MNIRYSILIFLFILVGCLEARYVDISQNAKYAHLIGQKFNTATDLLMYGITLKLERNRKIDYYIVTEPPGIGGPEVVSKAFLNAGTVVQVDKVLKCSNCLDFGSRVELQISVLSTPESRNSHIRIGDTSQRVLIEYVNGIATVNSDLLIRAKSD